MKNGWTTGQYIVYRVVLGVYVLQHFLGLLPWGTEILSSAGTLPTASLSPLMHLFPNIFLASDSPLFVTLLLVVGAGLSLCFIAGKFDRVAALSIWYLWASLYGRNPLIGNPSLPFVGWLLLAHLLIPSNSSHNFSEGNKSNSISRDVPEDIYLAAWILMTLAYSYSGYTKLVSPSWIDGSALSHVLSNPLARDTVARTFLLALPPSLLKIATWAALGLELSFAPLALFRRLRPWIWLAMVCLQLGLVFLINFADLTLGMLIVHLFTFDPAWIPFPRACGEPIFFDGNCGLCHGLVRFVLKEDRSAQPFSFAPLQGDFVRSVVAEEVRNKFPDSVVVLDGNNVLVRSAAVIYVMKRLGGLWFLAAALLNFVPRTLRGFGYDCIAPFRKNMFATKKEMCPLVAEPWRSRLHS